MWCESLLVNDRANCCSALQGNPRQQEGKLPLLFVTRTVYTFVYTYPFGVKVSPFFCLPTSVLRQLCSVPEAMAHHDPQVCSTHSYVWSTRDRLGYGATGTVYVGYNKVGGY